MTRTNFKELLQAGVHFGHLKKKYNPAMAPYVFMERNGIHIIDLNKTVALIEDAASAMKQIAKSGKKILFVATKKQAKSIIAETAESLNMPYITERWPGGLLTNFATIRKSIKKMQTIDKMKEDGTFDSLSKRERLQIDRQRAKLELNLGSIVKMTRMPEAIFVIDTNKERISIAEANHLGIRTFAMTDTDVKLTLTALDALETRERYLDFEAMITGDRYTFVKDAYVQSRDYEIFDGEMTEDDFLEDMDDFLID